MRSKINNIPSVSNDRSNVFSAMWYMSCTYLNCRLRKYKSRGFTTQRTFWYYEHLNYCATGPFICPSRGTASWTNYNTKLYVVIPFLVFDFSNYAQKLARLIALHHRCPQSPPWLCVQNARNSKGIVQHLQRTRYSWWGWPKERIG